MSLVSKQSHLVKSLAETDMLAVRFLEGIRPQKASATVLLLHGDLGTGKTTFTKSIARAIGVKDSVISPTFILEKKYKIKNNQYFKNLIHIDAYRFETEDEAKVLQLEEDLKEEDTLIVIEWPEKLGKYKPNNATDFFFKGIDENTKEISW